MRWHAFMIFVGLVVGTMNSAFGQQINCGPPPTLSQELQNNEAIKGNLQGKAQLLSKYVGQAELGGQIETTKSEIYTQSQDYYPAQQEAYLSYLFCSIISADPKFTTPEKLDALIKYKAARQKSSSNDLPPCVPSVLKNIPLPNVPTLDGNGNHVGDLSGIAVSVIQECPTPAASKQRAHLAFGYYNGSGTWRGEQHLTLVLKSSEGAVLKSQTVPLDRSRCIYGHAEQRNADDTLDGGIGYLVNSAELTVSRVSGTQTPC
ncbi:MULTISPECIES: hypothetical protein [unclassified Bradyrhizobium]|uniref:hypothetical protein n=1 Tax=unclassified Bradyrhizobium TaxID=2631580 RepID=UPI0020B2C35A|nr:MULTISPECIES: hypothetical protein [unclassified Bradyrhizobium]MCP3380171.1 hypothetical protein [Bradyrhizobium sp. CCGUVB4N]MCP3441032.1 hypothetical protein [Bradyrhizobium sp. CCGUVB14]